MVVNVCTKNCGESTEKGGNNTKKMVGKVQKKLWE